MRGWKLVAVAAAIATVGATGVLAQDSSDKKETPPERPALDADTLATQANIDVGKELWQQQCRHCHGRSAYPGKAPKLKPRRYKADFVYDRVTYGFRKMPAWEQVFDEQQRVGIVAFIMSKQFSP